MTAWWNSTTSVRKVRARSSARLRDLTFGIALISAVAAVDIDVTGASGRLFAPNVATGNPIQQDSITPPCVASRNSPSGRFLDLHLVRIERQMAGNLYHRRERRLVGPDCVLQRLAVGVDAEIVRVPLVRAMRGPLGAGQQRHIGVAPRHILHRRIA